MFPDGDEYSPLYSGSGTIISPNGYILTNAHVAKTSVTVYGGEDPAFLLVGLNQAKDKPPVFSYIAKVVAVDSYLDLALLRIVATSDGNKVNQGNLNLPYVDLGDSDQVHLDDHVYLFGFPSIGDATITYTKGIVAGFASEDQIGDHAYIKIDATQSGGISGGLAANDDAQIIGVPTIASAGTGGKNH